MGSQRQKTSKTRSRIEDSENQMQISESAERNTSKVHFQKRKIALEDLTNKSVIIQVKNMGNATDKEDELGSDQKQSINKPSGRQTRSKAKAIVSLDPINNCKKQTNSKNKSLLKPLTITKNSVDNKNDEETINVGMNLSNGSKCLRQTRRTVKESASQLAGTSMQLSLANLPDTEEMPDLKKSLNSSKNGPLPTGVPDSKSEMVETVQKPMRTRNMLKSQNIPTLNKADKPKEVSTESSTKGAKDDVPKTLHYQTESQVTQSPILKNNRSAASRKKEIATAKLAKPKRKTALEKWIEQAGEASLHDDSSSLSGSCRKSARLSISKLASAQLASPKNDSKINSPRSAVKRTLVTKKVPVWKTEPKPELLHSAPNDIYGFEYDASECKPPKKKRKRKPKKEVDVFKPSNGVVVPKLTKRPPRTAVNAVATEDAQESLVKSKPSHADRIAVNKTTPLLKAVAEKLNKMAEHLAVDESEKEDGLDDISHIYPIDNASANIYDVTLPENADADRELFSDERDKSTESGILAGDLEETEQVIPSHTSQAEADMENLFGFDDPESYPPVPSKAVEKAVEKELVKSTPIKQRTVTECFSSMSPVRKFAKATRKSVNRPARIDEDVARDLIRGIRPLQPAMDKQKPTTLMQYIKDVAEVDSDEEKNDPRMKVPLTPPTVFSQPPRRSYSKRELRTVKRTIFEADDDEEFVPSDDEEIAPKKSRKRVGGKTIQKKNKRDEEEEQWCKVMNSHFEDVEKFNLSS